MSDLDAQKKRVLISIEEVGVREPKDYPLLCGLCSAEKDQYVTNSNRTIFLCKECMRYGILLFEEKED
jgi:hypothetical protein